MSNIYFLDADVIQLLSNAKVAISQGLQQILKKGFGSRTIVLTDL